MYTIVATNSIKNWLNVNLSKYLINSNSQYVSKTHYENRTNGENFKITIYTSNTLTIEGSIQDRIYKQLLKIAVDQPEVGCDEVGVGDFFGPTVYVAAKLNPMILEKLGETFVSIKDSKKFSDAEIMEVFDKIKDIVEYNVQVVYDKDINNMNSVEQKVYYHFQNIKEVNERVIIDLFTTVNAFNKYQKQFNLVAPTDLILETKADSKFLSVALASIIARAIFLQEMDELEMHYNFTFPKGSSDKNMDNIIDEFIKKHGIEEIKKICKTSFKTYTKAEERWK